MRRTSFRTRLLLCFVILVAGVLVPPFLSMRGSVDEAVLAENREEAQRLLATSAWVLGEVRVPEGEDGLRAFNQRVRELATRLNVRVTYVVGGQVLADSDVPFERLPELEDHSTRPEVLAAHEADYGFSVRHSATLNRDLVYAAQDVDLGNGLPPGVLRLAIPLTRIWAARQAIIASLAWALPMSLALAAILSWILSRSLSSQVRSFAVAAQAVGRSEEQGAAAPGPGSGAPATAPAKLRDYPGGEFKPLADAINAMAGRIHSQMRELSEREARLASLFRGLAEGVLVLDGEGRVVSWNPALLAMFPAVKHFTGRTVLEATGSLELHQAVQRRLAAAGEPAPAPETVVATGDSVRPMGPELLSLRTPAQRQAEAAVETYRDAAGANLAVVVVRDVTRQREVQRMRREFVANASHELKTPLTSIIGYAETVLDAEEPDPATVRRFVEVILRNARHLARIVDELLALSRAEYRRVTSRLEPVSAQRTLTEALAGLQSAVEAKHLAVKTGPELAGLSVTADPRGLETVWRNLLENAVRYSPEGGALEIGASRLTGGEVMFSVRDHGPGVPPAERERVFQRFYRVPGQVSAKDGGAGLGLAICRHLVESFGGRIGLSDPPEGSGTLVTFTLAESRAAATSPGGQVAGTPGETPAGTSEDETQA